MRLIVIRGQFIRPDPFDRIECSRNELGATIGMSLRTVHLDDWGDVQQEHA